MIISKKCLDMGASSVVLDHGVDELVTCNESDFAVFEDLTVVDPISTS